MKRVERLESYSKYARRYSARFEILEIVQKKIFIDISLSRL